MISSNSPEEVFIVLIAHLCLGLFFLSSSTGKLANQHNFIREVIDYQILPKQVAKAFGYILPWIELIVAIGLILGMFLFISGLTVAFLLVCFTIAMTANLRRGREISCGCYGIVGTRAISWGMVARNVILLLLDVPVVWLAPNISEPGQWLALWSAYRAIFSSVSSIILLALTIASCFVIIQLAVWIVEIYSRSVRLKTSIDK